MELDGTEMTDETMADVIGSAAETPGAATTGVGTEPEEVVDEAAAARERLSSVADHIRRESRAARITAPDVFVAEPFSFTEEQLAQVWEDMAADESCADIVRTPDERTGSEVLHSLTFLSVPYARLLLRTQADDPAFTIAQTVRENSEIYPRATSVEYFEFEPFNLELAEVFAHLTVMEGLDEYADIRKVTVSNGMVYLYSDRYLTESRAQSIAQWDEVDSHLNSNQ